ncbi:MAG: hypothetical protein ACI36W_06650 [Coriobacteriales bacterium]
MRARENVRPSFARRALACLVSTAMCVAFTPVVAWGEGAASGELDVSQGSITITATGYAIGGGSETAYTGAYIITGTAAQAAGSSIVIASGTHEITLKDASIDVSEESGACAFEIAPGASVKLTLAGTSSLKSGNEKAALQVEEQEGAAAELLVTKGSTGSLECVGGDYAAGIGGGRHGSAGIVSVAGGSIKATGGFSGAGIGGGDRGNGGTVTITGGAVDVTAGNFGAGIGGGYGGSCVSVKITGGSVKAYAPRNGAGIGGGYQAEHGGIITITGGTVDASSPDKGAGIGGGYVGAGAAVTVSGGTVTAMGGNSGAGIGNGVNGSIGTFTTQESGSPFKGNAVIYANSIADSSQKSFWNCLFFRSGVDPIMYGTELAPTEDFTIPSGRRLLFATNQTITISAGVTVTNNGTIDMFNVGTLVNYGTITGNKPLNRTLATITPPVAQDGLVYDGTPKQLIKTPGSVSDGFTLHYWDGSLWASDAARVTASDAGSYTIDYNVANNSTNVPTGSLQYLHATIVKATPSLGIEASQDELSGGGTVTLAVSGVLIGEEPLVSCDNGIGVSSNGDGTYTAVLPDETKSYTFTASYEDNGNHAASSASCAVSVMSIADSAVIEPVEDALAAVPASNELKVTGAKASVKSAKGALKQVSALSSSQQALLDKALVRNANKVVARGERLITKADLNTIKLVKGKVIYVKAGSSKSISFKMKKSAAGTRVAYKKGTGAKLVTVSKNGKVLAKKGLKKGRSYTATVKVSCGEATKTVRVTVHVR